MNRREFVIGGLTAMGSGCVVSCAGHVTPRAPSGPVDVGMPADYSRDGVTARWAESHGFYIVREAGKLYAVSSNCTHKRCLVTPENDGRVKLACECHGSRFTEIGVVLKGPARVSLPHLGIMLDSTGHIIVDPSRRFDQAQWDQPGAYLAI